jgi:hypothetical protein
MAEPLPNAFADIEIDGVRYQLMAMRPEKVIDHGNALLGSMLAVPMSKAAVGDDAGYASALASMLGSLSHPTVKAAIADLWKDAFADGVPLEKTWNAHFLGHTGRLVKFVAWALEAQFSDFFGSYIAVLKQAGERVKARAQAAAEAKAAADAKASSPAP